MNDAKRALDFLKILGDHSKQDFIKTIRGRTMKNCDVTDFISKEYMVFGC